MTQAKAYSFNDYRLLTFCMHLGLILELGFIMPRKPHKRCVKGSKSDKNETRKRCISNQQICALCAEDRTGNIIVEPICKGRMTHVDLERLLRCIDFMELTLNILLIICIGLSDFSILIMKKMP